MGQIAERTAIIDAWNADEVTEQVGDAANDRRRD